MEPFWLMVRTLSHLNGLQSCQPFRPLQHQEYAFTIIRIGGIEAAGAFRWRSGDRGKRLADAQRKRLPAVPARGP